MPEITQPTFGGENWFTFGGERPARFGPLRERETEDPDNILRVDNAYAATLEMPNGDVRHIEDIYNVDPTREHTALSDWQLDVTAEDDLEEWCHADLTLTFDGRVIYTGTFTDIAFSSSEIAATISGPGAGADLDEGSYSVRYQNIEDWRAIQQAWTDLTDFDVYVVRPQHSVAIDEFEAEGTPLDILQEFHEDYGFRFTIDQKREKRATSFKAGRVTRRATWQVRDDKRSRSIDGYYNQVTVVGARKNDGTGDRYNYTAWDPDEQERLEEMGIDEPIEWHESDRSLESNQECRNRAEALLEEFVEEDKITGSVDVFPRLIDPGPAYTVDLWDDDRISGPFSLHFDGAYIEIPTEALDDRRDRGAWTAYVRPQAEDEEYDYHLFGASSGEDVLRIEAADEMLVTAPSTDNELELAIAPDGVTLDEWHLIYVDWASDGTETRVRVGHYRLDADREVESEHHTEGTLEGRLALPEEAWYLGRHGTRLYTGNIDDPHLLREPPDREVYDAMAQLRKPPARLIASRWPFNEARVRTNGEIVDVIGGYHAKNEGATHAGSPKTLESLTYSEGDDSADCTLNFERVPSEASKREALRRRLRKVEKRL